VVMEGEPVQVIASAYHSVRGGSTAFADAERKAEEQRLTTERRLCLRPGTTVVACSTPALVPRRVYAALHAPATVGLGFSSENWQHFTRLSLPASPRHS